VRTGDREDEQEHARKIRAELIRDPRAVRCLGSQIAARMVDEAERARLREYRDDPEGDDDWTGE
jgi:hypothetical protein